MSGFVNAVSDSIIKQVVIWPDEDFLESKNTPNDDKAAQSIAKDIFELLGQTVELKFKITFKLSNFGEPNISNRNAPIQYLKAINVALRKFHEKGNHVPVVSLFLPGAMINDVALQIITNLINDNLVGSFDSTLEHICLLDLRENQFTSNSVCKLAQAIDQKFVWMLDLRGNSCALDEQAVKMLSKLKNPSVMNNLSVLSREIKW